MLSKGVTASNDSVAPAPKPAITVPGPDIFPSASESNDLYVSNATNLMPALIEFPIIKVVHPAYHCCPKRGQGSFFPSGNLRFS